MSCFLMISSTSISFWVSSKPNSNGLCLIWVSCIFKIVLICLSRIIFISFSVNSSFRTCGIIVSDICVSIRINFGLTLFDVLKNFLKDDWAKSVENFQSLFYNLGILTNSPSNYLVPSSCFFMPGIHWCPKMCWFWSNQGSYLFLLCSYGFENSAIFFPLRCIFSS